MQFLKLSIVVAALSGLGLANRADTIKQGLRIVNNHQADAYRERASEGTRLLNDGRLRDFWPVQRQAEQHHRNAHNIAKAVGGQVIRPQRRSLEFLGSDDTHEYFARSIEEDFEDYY